MPGRGAVGRKVRDAAEAHALLAAWSASGERMTAWCASRGINWYSLSAYKGWGDGTFVEVEVQATKLVPRGPSSSSPSARYRIVLGERAVEVGQDFDDDVLRRLVRAVEAC